MKYRFLSISVAALAAAYVVVLLTVFLCQPQPAPELAMPEASSLEYCDGLPPVYGTDC